MRAQVTALGIFSLLLSLSDAPAVAKPAGKEQTVVLLPLEGEGATPALLEELVKAMGKLGKSVQLSSLKLDELMLAVGCSDTSVACLQKIGQSIKAESLILANLRQGKGMELELSLRWFDVKSGGDSGQAKRLLSAEEEARRDQLLQAVQSLFGIRTAPSGALEESGGLSISASVPFVEIVLDGQPRGVVPLELRNLKTGTYSILARRDGFVTWQGHAEVRADQMTRVEIDMVPSAQGTKPPSYFDTIRKQTWVVAGAGLAGIIIGSAFAAHMSAQQSKMNDAKGITLDEIRRMEDYKHAGERDALAANICFGLGGGALVAAVILSYLDYRHARHAPPQDTRERTTRIEVGPGQVRLGVSF
jgi:hypothetical protein